MKKLFLAGAIFMSSLCVSSVCAQSVLSNLLSGVANAAAAGANASNNATANGGNGSQAAKSAVTSSLLNTAVSSVNNSTAGSSASGLISNLISAVAGDMTTSQGTMVGTWKYAAPCIQFESEDYLVQAGGAAIAEKLEKKLVSVYKLVGIRSGLMTFTFDANGKMTYAVGSISREATYVFDDATKTISITTPAGATMKAYVTISGDEMYLCFDTMKFVNFMCTLGSRFSALKSVTTIVGSYKGIKVGFKFTK